MIETVAGLTDLQIKLFAAIAQTLVALAVGSIAAGIALRQSRTAEQQAKTARNKLRLDLFQRRLELYEAIDRSARAALNDSSGGHKDLELAIRINESRWLFGPELSDFASEKIHHALVDFAEANTIRRQLNHSHPLEGPEQAEYEKATKDRSRLRKAVFRSLGELRTRMDEYLVLEH